MCKCRDEDRPLKTRLGGVMKCSVARQVPGIDVFYDNNNNNNNNNNDNNNENF